MSVVVGVLLLAVFTYLIRAGGTLLPHGDETSLLQRVTGFVAVALLGAVVMTSTIFDGAEFAGWARLCGVTAGVTAALLRAPLLAVVIIAIVVTAGLRLVGVA